MQTMAQALLFVIGFCLAPARYLPPFEFANTYGGEHNKGLIVGIVNFAGYLGTAVFNIVLPSLVSLVGWRGVLAYTADMLLVASLVFGYLQWWQAVDPVRALVVGGSGEGLPGPSEKEPLISGRKKYVIG